MIQVLINLIYALKHYMLTPEINLTLKTNFSLEKRERDTCSIITISRIHKVCAAKLLN